MFTCLKNCHNCKIFQINKPLQIRYVKCLTHISVCCVYNSSGILTKSNTLNVGTLHEYLLRDTFGLFLKVLTAEITIYSLFIHYLFTIYSLLPFVRYALNIKLKMYSLY